MIRLFYTSFSLGFGDIAEAYMDLASQYKTPRRLQKDYPIKHYCYIMLTCPCNEDPLTPHFYIVKRGFTGVYIFFIIFALKHKLWVLVRNRLNEAVLTCTNNLCFEQNRENITNFHLKIVNFYSFKNCCILHRLVDC